MEMEMPRLRNKWRVEEEDILIYLWSQHIEALRAPNQRNRPIYTAMSEAMEEYGMIKSVGEIKLKINNLTSKYRKEKMLMESSGEGPSTWRHFKNINQIITTSPNFDISSKEETSIEPPPEVSSPEKKSSTINDIYEIMQRQENLFKESLEEMRKSEKAFIELEAKKLALMKKAVEDDAKLNDAMISFMENF